MHLSEYRAHCVLTVFLFFFLACKFPGKRELFLYILIITGLVWLLVYDMS